MKPGLDELREWLGKAFEDLRSARILIEHSPPVYETACFHAQQAVEKALKGFLVWSGVVFEKVHDLTYLLDLCESRQPAFSNIRPRVDALSPYAVETRYPGTAMGVSSTEAEEALAAAWEAWNLITGFLPPEAVQGYHE